MLLLCSVPSRGKRVYRENSCSKLTCVASHGMLLMYNVLVISWEWGRDVVDNRNKGKVAEEMNREEGDDWLKSKNHVYPRLT